MPIRLVKQQLCCCMCHVPISFSLSVCFGFLILPLICTAEITKSGRVALRSNCTKWRERTFMCSNKMSKVYNYNKNTRTHAHTEALIKFNQSKYLISFSLSISFYVDKICLFVLVVRHYLSNNSTA